MAATEGAFDGLPIENVKAAQNALLAYLEQHNKKVVEELDEGSELSEVAKKTVVEAAQNVAKQYKVEKEK